MKDLFSGHARSYALFRPDYPKELYDLLFSRCTAFNKAWDVATGNGQVANILSKRFKHVIATDISENQLKYAAAQDNISYRVEESTKSSIADNSIDLITVGQAIHWFDLNKFEYEAKRVLAPGGIFSYWGYGLLSISNKHTNNVVAEFYQSVTSPFWEPERNLIDSEYDSFKPELFTIEKFHYSGTFKWTRNQLLAYLDTWSVLRTMRALLNIDPLEYLSHEILSNDDGEFLDISFPIFLYLAKVS